MALAASLFCGLILLTMIANHAAQVVESINFLMQKMQAENETVQSMLRITGIALLTQLGAQICRDAEAAALAQKVELAGKCMILCVVLPLLGELCEEALSLLH